MSIFNSKFFSGVIPRTSLKRQGKGRGWDGKGLHHGCWGMDTPDCEYTAKTNKPQSQMMNRWHRCLINLTKDRLCHAYFVWLATQINSTNIYGRRCKHLNVCINWTWLNKKLNFTYFMYWSISKSKLNVCVAKTEGSIFGFGGSELSGQSKPNCWTVSFYFCCTSHVPLLQKFGLRPN